MFVSAYAEKQNYQYLSLNFCILYHSLFLCAKSSWNITEKLPVAETYDVTGHANIEKMT